MRRSTLVLIATAIAIVVVALLLRSGTPGESPTTTLSTASSLPPGTTTSEAPTTTLTTTTLPEGVEVCEFYGGVANTGTVRTSDLVEASGIAASRVANDVFWSHNDSRGGPVLYAFDSSGGNLGGFEIPGAFSLDWEDMSAGPGPDGQGQYLYVGDIGDNFGIRSGNITVYRVPDVDPATLDGAFNEAVAFAFRYPDGAHNAEALFIDPLEPALYIATKDRTESLVYKGALEPANEPTELDLIAALPLGAEVSAGDMSPDGTTLVLRGYESVWLWHRGGDESIAEMLRTVPCNGPSPEEVQGESITFDIGLSYWTISEGSNPPIHVVRRSP